MQTQARTKRRFVRREWDNSFGGSGTSATLLVGENRCQIQALQHGPHASGAFDEFRFDQELTTSR